MFKLKLDKLMVEKRVNTRQLSEMTGIRWNTIDDMAKNKARHWSLDNLEKIYTALGLSSVNELIEFEDK